LVINKYTTMVKWYHSGLQNQRLQFESV